MQIFSLGENLHEMSNLFSGKSKKNIINLLSFFKKMNIVNEFGYVHYFKQGYKVKNQEWNDKQLRSCYEPSHLDRHGCLRLALKDGKGTVSIYTLVPNNIFTACFERKSFQQATSGGKPHEQWSSHKI